MKTVCLQDQWTTFLAVSWLVKRGGRIFLIQGNPVQFPPTIRLLIC
jgi:hypothetical protein